MTEGAEAAAPGRTIAVVGLGSIGGIMAGWLAATGRHQVTGCARTLSASLRVDGPDAARTDVALRCLTDPAQATPADWVLVCTKTQDTDASAAWLNRLCGPQTHVAVLQNGVGHAERVAPHVGAARVVPAIVYCNGERLGPGHVRYRQATAWDLAVPDDAAGRAFAALLEGTRLRTLLSPDFRTLAWRKLVINVIANPLTALTLQRQTIFRRADVQALCLAILDEAVAVGRADGAALAPDEAAQTLATLLTYPADAGTSMYFDRLAGRRLEAAALTGAVVAGGERHGIATPLNRALLTMLSVISDAAGTPG